MNWNDGTEDYNIIHRLRKELAAAKQALTMHTRVTDLARVLVRAADIAEKDLADRLENAGAQGRGYTRREWANYRLLRWLADGATEIADEDDPVVE